MFFLNIKFFKKKFCIVYILIHLAGILFCAGPAVKHEENLRFSITGNTRGESPYSGPGVKLGSVIKKINTDNPVFIVHLGGLIHGGIECNGLSGIDIDRQYREIFSEFSRLLPIVYTVKGESDSFNNASDFYTEHSGRKDYYSFNYGALHFVVINSSPPGAVFENQKKWILDDFKKAQKNQEIFVFMNNPVYGLPKTRLQAPALTDTKFQDLHNIFINYKVKAVFSGYPAVFYKNNVDGILYINAGCGGFNKNEASGSCQYYIVDYKNGELSVQQKFVN